MSLLVENNYCDHANDPVPQKCSSKLLREKPNKFISTLYELLGAATYEGFDHIISWQPHGRAFVIRNPQQMAQYVLPRYDWKITKYTSFARQLNVYGFTSISQGPDRGAYYHELFLCNRPHLLPQMQRIAIKGTGLRSRASPRKQPDFWAMIPWLCQPIVNIPPQRQLCPGGNKSQKRIKKVRGNASNKVTKQERPHGKTSLSSRGPSMCSLRPLPSAPKLPRPVESSASACRREAPPHLPAATIPQGGSPLTTPRLFVLHAGVRQHQDILSYVLSVTATAAPPRRDEPSIQSSRTQGLLLESSLVPQDHEETNDDNDDEDTKSLVSHGSAVGSLRPLEETWKIGANNLERACGSPILDHDSASESDPHRWKDGGADTTPHEVLLGVDGLPEILDTIWW